MKIIYSAILLLIFLGGCKTFSFSTNPDKSAFNSGTIGSVNATNYLPYTYPGTISPQDTSMIKSETAHQNHLVIR